MSEAQEAAGSRSIHVKIGLEFIGSDHTTLSVTDSITVGWVRTSTYVIATCVGPGFSEPADGVFEAEVICSTADLYASARAGAWFERVYGRIRLLDLVVVHDIAGTRGSCCV